MEFNGEEYHVHLLVNLSPDNHISEFVKFRLRMVQIISLN
ncbi:hypothetical protein [Calothrix rhizosoleniae]